MHGIVFVELQRFTQAVLGPEAWGKIVLKAGTPHSHYLTASSYPDEELVALVVAASQISKLPPPELLESFGKFMVPGLLSIFKAYVRKEWTALDLIANTESAMHRAVRIRDRNAEPPTLQIDRPDPSRVVVHYRSARRLCAVGKGILKGIGERYGESLEVVEHTCMHRGDPQCTIAVVKQVA